MPGGKVVARCILDDHDIKGSLVLLLGNDGSYSPSIAATGDHAHLANVELGEV